MSAGGRVRIWDPLVRLLHVGLIAGMVAAWTTTEFMMPWHATVGYGVLVVVALRGLWGLCGSRHARFRQFVRSPRITLAYAGALLRGREPRYVGHNPLGGWMVVALLAGIAATAITGWLYTTDRFWGDEAVEMIHRGLAWCVLALVAAHVAGVVFTSLRHRENLVRAMLDGRKPVARDGDIV